MPDTKWSDLLPVPAGIQGTDFVALGRGSANYQWTFSDLLPYLNTYYSQVGHGHALATVSAAGFLKTLANDPALYMDSQGNWTVPPTSGGGEANTASNVGTGVGIWQSKVGVDLRFKSLRSSDSSITIVSEADTVDLQAPAGTGEANVGANVGAGVGQVYRNKTGVTLNLKTFRSSDGTVTYANEADTIDIKNAKPLAAPTAKGQLWGHNGSAFVTIPAPTADNQLPYSSIAESGYIKWDEAVATPIGGPTLYYTFQDDVTVSDPLAGNVKVNNANMALATVLSINDTTRSGANADPPWSVLREGDYISIWDEKQGAVGGYYEINGTPIDQGTWYQFPVAAAPGGSWGIQDNRNVAMSLIIDPASVARLAEANLWQKGQTYATLNVDATATPLVDPRVGQYYKLTNATVTPDIDTTEKGAVDVKFDTTVTTINTTNFPNVMGDAPTGAHKKAILAYDGEDKTWTWIGGYA